MTRLEADQVRYEDGKMPAFQRYFRKAQMAKSFPLRFLYRVLYTHYRRKNMIDLALDTKIGGGLYVGHPYCITINPKAVIGENVNIHKGVTVGQENRGRRKGAPIIGSLVWIGVNSTIVGNVHIGDDVLIAPNSYVNCDVPSHSVVFGNPCVIKHREDATREYINRII